jgi:hypothetical protein
MLQIASASLPLPKQSFLDHPPTKGQSRFGGLQVAIRSQWVSKPLIRQGLFGQREAESLGGHVPPTLQQHLDMAQNLK